MRAKPVVADASVIIKWVIPEDYSEHATRLLDDHLEGRVAVHTPRPDPLEAAGAPTEVRAPRAVDERPGRESPKAVGGSRAYTGARGA